MNVRFSTPLCQNCCATEITCQADMEKDFQPCCAWCEHSIEGRVSRVAGITLTRPAPSPGDPLGADR